MAVTPTDQEYADGLATWGSHQPALKAIARFMPIRSVIEFGCGVFSTPLFLDRGVFPDLESLVTFDHDLKWAEKVQMTIDDPRHDLIVAQPKRFAALSAAMQADFVFIDCKGDRISLVPHGLTIAPLFAIHDCQPEELAHLDIAYLRGFNSKIQTVVGSNTIDLSGLIL